MSKKDFELFLRKANQQPAALDWETRKVRWISKVEELLSIFEGHLAEYTQARKVVITRNQVEVQEERVGSYLAPSLSIRLGPSEVRLLPIGTFIFGAFGRVDLVGVLGRVRFVLVDKNSGPPRIKVRIVNQQREEAPAPAPVEWSSLEWKIASAPPELAYRPVSEEAVLDAILEVSNG
jgi:hypothetical protein